MFKLGQKHTK